MCFIQALPHVSWFNFCRNTLLLLCGGGKVVAPEWNPGFTSIRFTQIEFFHRESQKGGFQMLTFFFPVSEKLSWTHFTAKLTMSMAIHHHHLCPALPNTLIKLCPQSEQNAVASVHCLVRHGPPCHFPVQLILRPWASLDTLFLVHALPTGHMSVVLSHFALSQCPPLMYFFNFPNVVEMSCLFSSLSPSVLIFLQFFCILVMVLGTANTRA